MDESEPPTPTRTPSQPYKIEPTSPLNRDSRRTAPLRTTYGRDSRRTPDNRAASAAHPTTRPPRSLCIDTNPGGSSKTAPVGIFAARYWSPQLVEGLIDYQAPIFKGSVEIESFKSPVMQKARFARRD